MPVLKEPEPKNVWRSILKESREKKFEDAKKANQITEFDSSKHSLVFYGQAFTINKVDDERLLQDFDSTISHPACYGYTIKKYVEKKEAESSEKPLPHKNKCTEREYLEYYVFPTLLPALERMLENAKINKCFERKRTAFNACDFITEYLYKNNPNCDGEVKQKRSQMTLWDIPFVNSWIIKNPRPPLPKSLVWSEEEAAIKIQAFYRGYRVRCDPEVQEMRQWQRELREENQNINQRVEEFWQDTSSNKPNQKQQSSLSTSHLFNRQQRQK